MNDHVCIRIAAVDRILDHRGFLSENYIAITGSVARGDASPDSDVELNVWVPSISDTWNSKSSWLRSQLLSLTTDDQFENLYVDSTPIEDGSIWASFRFMGIWFEVGYQTIANQDKLITNVVSGETCAHDILVGVEALVNSLVLRDDGKIARWKALLHIYPEDLQRRLIADVFDNIAFPPRLIVGGDTTDVYLFYDYLIKDIHNLFRLQFAAECIWEPNWKRLASRYPKLDGLSNFLDEIHPDRISCAAVENVRKVVYRRILEIAVTLPFSIRNIDVEQRLLDFLYKPQ